MELDRREEIDCHEPRVDRTVEGLNSREALGGNRRIQREQDSMKLGVPGWSGKRKRGSNVNSYYGDDKDEVNVLNLDLALSLSYDYTKLNKKRFRCTTCDKSFSSFQALGGHRSSHSKFQIVDKKGEQRREHRCKTCDKTFDSGQALGGHQRRHWAGPNPEINTNNDFLFDLNHLPSQVI